MPDSNDPIFKSKWDRGVFSPLSVSVALHAMAIVGLSGFLGNWGVQKMMAQPEPEIWVEVVMADVPDQKEEIVQDAPPVQKILPPVPMPLPEERDVESAPEKNPSEYQNEKEELEKPVSPVQPPVSAQAQTRQAAAQLRGVGDAESYTAHIVSRINAHKFYPSHARQRHEEGDVVLSFHVSRSGDVGNIRIVQSSFSHALDGAAIQAVKASAPFDPPPSYLPERLLQFNLPIRYRLKEK
ncbi:MAG TPA: energy transducer TonB [Alphaproteobacteria bacterium]|nr:energy transducer TonB [Alphaproteobacteria bacterium]HNS44240.1 energy transducer TonB [Alphaproteobacteria bacterium]